MVEVYLWVTGSSIFLILGIIHLYYTFFTNKFSSKSERVVQEMKSASPILTKETSIWKAWIGFNASHSSGAMFIGIVNIYVAVTLFENVRNDPFYFLLNLLTVGFYLWLARKFWFRIPFMGILTTLVCYTISFVLTMV